MCNRIKELEQKLYELELEYDKLAKYAIVFNQIGSSTRRIGNYHDKQNNFEKRMETVQNRINEIRVQLKKQKDG